MALGFLALGLIVGLILTLSGVRKSWVIVGLWFSFLNLAWWYSVEKEVVSSINSSLIESMSLRIFRTYISDAVGAFAGGLLGQMLVNRIINLRTQE